MVRMVEHVVVPIDEIMVMVYNHDKSRIGSSTSVIRESSVPMVCDVFIVTKVAI